MVMRIKGGIKLYMMYVSNIVKSIMQYKLSFILMFIGRFLVSFSGFVSLAFLFSDFTDSAFNVTLSFS